MPRGVNRSDPNTSRDTDSNPPPARSRGGRRMPKVRHHKHTGRAVVTIEGRDIYLGRWGTAEAEAAYHRLIAEYVSTGLVEPPNRRTDVGPTVDDLILAYWRYAERVYDAKTVNGSLKPACRRLRRHHGPTPVALMTAGDLRRLQLALTDETDARGRRLSRPYVNKLIARIKRVFKWGVAEGLVPVTVWQELSVIGGLRRGTPDVRETERVRAVDDGVIERTLPELPPVIRSMVRLQRLTGMRPGEVCAMTWDQIDTSGEVWLYRPQHHKNAHRDLDREIAIGPTGQRILLPYRGRPGDRAIFSPAENMAMVNAKRRAERRTPLTPSQRARDARNASKTNGRRPGKQYTTASYAWAIRRACERLEIEVWTPNRLRHTAATDARERFGLDAAYTLLGHAKPDTTLIYAERTRAARIELAKKLG